VSEAARSEATPRERPVWIAAAALVGLAALGVTFHGYWGAPLRASVPVPRELLPAPGAPAHLARPVVEADYHLAAWAVARNAYTLLHRPANLFEAEPCFPAASALTLHHPVITTALVAAPVYAVTGDPIATFNAAVWLKIAVGFAAMVLLVWDWTRSPPAAVAAALLYAFHAAQVEHPYHVFSSDNAWLLLALFCARRLFAAPRWITAVGLAAACTAQLATSFYPLLAAVLAAAPVSLWLLWHHRRDPLPWTQIAVALALVVAVAALLFAPYLTHAAENHGGRGRVFYASWSAFLPGGKLFPGWCAVALLIAACVAPRRLALAGIGGEPRPALWIAAGLVALFAAGGNVNAQLAALAEGGDAPLVALPNPFAALAGILPGLRSVRLPSELALVSRELLCVLAGIGAAGALRVLPARARSLAGAALVAAVFLEGIALPGMGEGPRFGAFRLRPPDAEIDFFAGLAAAGNRGPLLELPLHRGNPAYTFRAAPRQQLLTAYHHRRTSACYVSFIPDSVRALAEHAAELPGPAGVERIRALGFTTVVVHRDPALPDGEALNARFRSADAGSRLVPIAASAGLAAFRIEEAAP